MKAFKVAILAATALAVTVPAASASTVTYATLVDWQQGSGAGSAGRSDTANATGAPDGVFLSLGLGGIGIFSFGGPFTAPGTVVEVTNGVVATYPESADVYVGTSHNTGNFDLLGQGFQLVGNITNVLAQYPGMTIPFDGTWNFLALVDTTKRDTPNSPSSDGFDVDAVGVSVVPLPAAGLLALSGFGLLGGLGLRGRNRRPAGTA